MSCPRSPVLSVVTQPDVIERILHHLDLPTEPPSSSRAPPAQGDLAWDGVSIAHGFGSRYEAPLTKPPPLPAPGFRDILVPRLGIEWPPKLSPADPVGAYHAGGYVVQMGMLSRWRL